MVQENWPAWWDWELEFGSHLLKRMEDRRFTEIDLRDMLERATDLERDIEPGRWTVTTRHRRQRWEIIVEPDAVTERLVVVTAYPLRGK